MGTPRKPAGAKPGASSPNARSPRGGGQGRKPAQGEARAPRGAAGKPATQRSPWAEESAQRDARRASAGNELRRGAGRGKPAGAQDGDERRGGRGGRGEQPAYGRAEGGRADGNRFEGNRFEGNRAEGGRGQGGRGEGGRDQGDARGGRSAGYAGRGEGQGGHEQDRSRGQGRGPGQYARGEGGGARGEMEPRAGRGFGNIEQRGHSAEGEHRTSRGKPIDSSNLPVERAKKMRLRKGSEKQEMYAQQLREKRVDSRFIGDLRIQKALALTGVGSRRDCDEWVAQGRVSINGAVVEPGARVKPGDRVLFDGKLINIKWPDRLPRIVIYHKQEGELVSRDDPEGRTTVFDRLPKVSSSAWVAVGRLDFNTSGLLIFTTSGDLANRLMHPRFEVEREYAVRVLGSLTDEQKAELRKGVELEDGEARFDVLEDQGGEGQNHWYRVILREGRNREVRRMFEHFDLQVSRLMRVRFGSLTLPSRLKRGQYYELEEPEVLAVLKWAGLGLTGRTPTR